jgi:hypothetical protein
MEGVLIMFGGPSERTAKAAGPGVATNPGNSKRPVGGKKAPQRKNSSRKAR